MLDKLDTAIVPPQPLLPQGKKFSPQKWNSKISSSRGAALHALLSPVVGNFARWKEVPARRRVHSLQEFILAYDAFAVREYVHRKRQGAGCRAIWLAHCLDDLLTRIDGYGLTHLRVEPALPIFRLGEFIVDIGAPDISGTLPNGKKMYMEIKTGSKPNCATLPKVCQYLFGGLLEHQHHDHQPIECLVWVSYSIRESRHQKQAHYTHTPYVMVSTHPYSRKAIDRWLADRYRAALKDALVVYRHWKGLRPHEKKRLLAEHP